MDKFSEIKQRISSELDIEITLLEQTLRTRVPLADTVIHYFLEKKGKMVRPIMTILAARLLCDESATLPQATFDGAVSLELLHNATLMHDDVVDESDERRGSATINQKWDNKVAVLMGDFFLAKCLLRCSISGIPQILETLTDLVTQLSEGELEQLSNMRAKALNEDSYFSVIDGKTASLFSACMRVGGYSVKAPSDSVNLLGRIGLQFGEVFQIRDDIFDYYESTEVGKPTGHDIQEGKITLPLLYALQHGPKSETERIKALLDAHNLSTEDVSTIVNYAIAGGGIEYAYAKMKSIALEAKTSLMTFPDNSARKSLLELLDYFIERRK